MAENIALQEVVMEQNATCAVLFIQKEKINSLQESHKKNYNVVNMKPKL